MPSKSGEIVGEIDLLNLSNTKAVLYDDGTADVLRNGRWKREKIEDHLNLGEGTYLHKWEDGYVFVSGTRQTRFPKRLGFRIRYNKKDNTFILSDLSKEKKIRKNFRGLERLSLVNDGMPVGFTNRRFSTLGSTEKDYSPHTLFVEGTARSVKEDGKTLKLINYSGSLVLPNDPNGFSQEIKVNNADVGGYLATPGKISVFNGNANLVLTSPLEVVIRSVNGEVNIENMELEGKRCLPKEEPIGKLYLTVVNGDTRIRYDQNPTKNITQS